MNVYYMLLFATNIKNKAYIVNDLIPVLFGKIKEEGRYETSFSIVVFEKEFLPHKNV